MEVVFHPPRAVLWVALAVLGLTVASLFIKPGFWPRKLTALAIVLVVIGGVLLVAYRRTTLTVSERGLSLSSFMPLKLAWEEIDGAMLIEDLWSSPYRPVVKVRGISAGAYRSGVHRLANGGQARVLTEQRGQALLLKTGTALYLFACPGIAELAAEVGRYVPLKRGAPLRRGAQ